MSIHRIPVQQPDTESSDRARSRLFVTRHEARQTVHVLRSAAGTLAVHDGAMSVVEAIATAAEHLAPGNAHQMAMYARSALVGYALLDLDAHHGYTVPTLLGWRVSLAAQVIALNGAADRLAAAVRALTAGKVFEGAA